MLNSNFTHKEKQCLLFQVKNENRKKREQDKTMKNESLVYLKKEKPHTKYLKSKKRKILKINFYNS